MKRTIALLAALAIAPSAFAADLGGNCCSDLEERIAELEATTARKGNRKLSLTVFGQISKSLLWIDAGGDTDKAVIENGVSPSRFGFKGEAKINEGLSAGYVLEVGAGKFSLDGGNSNDLEVRHSYVYLNTGAGKVSLGQTSQATDGIVEISTANTDAAMNTLNLKPLFGTSPWDGDRANVVRYDTPVFGGFVASASWTRDLEDPLFGSPFLSESWDVALRYAGEYAGFKVAGGAGYRTVELFGDEVNTISGSLSVKHVLSGVFGTAAVGDVDIFGDSVRGYHGVAGIERNVFGYGATTVFAEALKVDIGGGDDAKLYGIGVVQAIDAAAMDLYVTYRTSDDADLSYGLAGARVRF